MAAQIVKTQMTRTEIFSNETLVVMPGFGELFETTLSLVAQEFGWSVETVSHPEQAAAVTSNRRIAAVFFHRQALGPDCSGSDALRQLRATFPEAHLIPCHGFSDPIDWDQLSGAGAFHSLWLPVKENELRQCLGFIWQTSRVPAKAERSAQKSGLSLTYSAA
jgi:DNA-binding NtrC family response regulator